LLLTVAPRQVGRGRFCIKGKQEIRTNREGDQPFDWSDFAITNIRCIADRAVESVM
jgi:hypothetical protein